jgi:uncharacterized protein YwqG
MSELIVEKNNEKLSKDITDFNNLPPSCYVSAFTPKTVKIDSGKDAKKETGLEEKFGGKVPFFVKGEKWPLSPSGAPMSFFCQLKDLRKNNNILYRVFIDIGEYSDYCDFFIGKIELNKENLKNQIQLELPDFPIAVELFDAYKITGWNHNYELRTQEFILKELDINIDYYHENYQIMNDSYYDNEFAPHSGIKVGGTPCFTQSFDEKMVNTYSFLQLSEQSILPHGWGDSGIGHISEDGYLYMDCC